MDDITNLKATDRIIAIGAVDSGFAALELRRKGHTLELSLVQRGTLTDVRRALGPDAARAGRKNAELVLGLDTVGVACYRMKVPLVNEQETAAMLRMQAETRLPLPIDQMKIDWRRLAVRDKESDVLMVAVRKATVQSLLERYGRLRPHAVVLEAEAVVEAWKWMFAHPETGEGIIVYCGAQHTVVCIAQAGRLAHATVLDSGIDDLQGYNSAISDSFEHTAQVTPFVQDLVDVIDGYRRDSDRHLPVTLLSSGADIFHILCRAMARQMDDVKEAQPNPALFGGRQTWDPADLYAYGVPIGLALCVLDNSLSCLTLYTQDNHDGANDRTAKRRITPFKAACAAAGAILVMGVTLYGLDYSRYQRLQGRMQDTEVKRYLKEKAFQKTVARQRPDLIDMINKLSGAEHEGIVLNTLDFQKGRPVKVTGQADKSEQLYKYEEALLAQPGIKMVVLDNPVKDTKSKKVKFTITFHYKTFTQRVVKKQ